MHDMLLMYICLKHVVKGMTFLCLCKNFRQWSCCVLYLEQCI